MTSADPDQSFTERATRMVRRGLDAVYGTVAAPGDDDQRRLEKTLVMVAGLVGAPMTTGTAVLALALGAPNGVWVSLFSYAVALIVGITFLVVARRGFDTMTVVLLGGNLAVSAATTYFGGGIGSSGGNIMWGIVAPVIALLIYSRRTALAWFGVYVVAATGAIALAPPAETAPSGAFQRAFFIVTLIGVSLFVFGSLLYFLGEREKARRIAEIERARSDALLRNILPDEIAAQLKAGASIIADHFDDATVLFADIADFTPMSAQMPPDELVELLNDAFSEFDRLAYRFGVEKIKTIGDCYMAAAGVPTPRDDHAAVLARMALEIRDLVARRTFRGHDLRFRIGLDSGPLVAGVIGERKFIYDLWGDTVNTASRMESHGIAGRIQVTDATRRHLADGFYLSERGSVVVKGKGEMRTFILEGER